MEKKEFEELIVKKRKGPTQVVSFRIPVALQEKLEKKGIDVPKTIRHLLERLAD